MQVFSILLVAAALLISPSLGHARFKVPKPRTTDSNLKTGPCGQIAATIGDTTVIAPGPRTIYFEETIAHVGAPFRIALSQTDGNFESCVLLNHIPQRTGSVAIQKYAVTIDIPNFNCANCRLQLLQVMTDKIPQGTSCTYNPADTTGNLNNQCFSNYHSCSNIQITGTQPFNAAQCTQPSGWPFANTLVYTQEPGGWNGNFVLTAANIPASVKQIVNNDSYIGLVIANANSGSTTGSGTPTTDSGIFGSGGGNTGLYAGIGGGAAVLAAGAYFVYRKKRMMGSLPTTVASTISKPATTAMGNTSSRVPPKPKRNDYVMT